MAVGCCVVVADEQQAEFIYEHVEGVKALAGTRVGSVGIHDYVGIVHGPYAELHEESVWPAVVTSRLVQACNLVITGHGSHVPATRGKVSVPEAEHSCKIHAEFLQVVLAAWHDGACCQDSQFLLQQVEERIGVVKTFHEQHVVLVGDLRVLHETTDNTAG